MEILIFVKRSIVDLNVKERLH